MDSQPQLITAAHPCLKMPDQETFQAIHFHLESMTTVIERMAGNSESSKTWCISLVSAIVVVASEEKMPPIFSLAFLPTLMFFVLDVYYLSLERGFRSSYTDFVKKLHSGTWEFEDLYLFDPGNVGPQILRAVGSFSVWPFYGLLAIGIIFVSFVFVPRS